MQTLTIQGQNILRKTKLEKVTDIFINKDYCKTKEHKGIPGRSEGKIAKET